MPLSASQFLDLVVGTVRGQLVPHDIKPAEFDSIIGEHRPQLLARLNKAFDPLPWRGFLAPPERAAWRGALASADGTVSRVAELRRGGLVARLEDGREVHSSKLEVVGARWRRLTPSEAENFRRRFLVLVDAPRAVQTAEAEVLRLVATVPEAAREAALLGALRIFLGRSDYVAFLLRDLRGLSTTGEHSLVGLLVGVVDGGEARFVGALGASVEDGPETLAVVDSDPRLERLVCAGLVYAERFADRPPQDAWREAASSATSAKASAEGSAVPKAAAEGSKKPKMGDVVEITGVRSDGTPEFQGLTGVVLGFRGEDADVDVAGVGSRWIATNRLVTLAAPKPPTKKMLETLTEISAAIDASNDHWVLWPATDTVTRLETRGLVRLMENRLGGPDPRVQLTSKGRAVLTDAASRASPAAAPAPAASPATSPAAASTAPAASRASPVASTAPAAAMAAAGNTVGAVTSLSDTFQKTLQRAFDQLPELGDNSFLHNIRLQFPAAKNAEELGVIFLRTMALVLHGSGYQADIFGDFSKPLLLVAKQRRVVAIWYPPPKLELKVTSGGPQIARDVMRAHDVASQIVREEYSRHGRAIEALAAAAWARARSATSTPAAPTPTPATPASPAPATTSPATASPATASPAKKRRVAKPPKAAQVSAPTATTGPASGGLRREALEAFKRNFPTYTLEPQPTTGSQRNAEKGATYGLVPDGGSVVAWVDVFDDDVDVEWTAKNPLRPAERERLEQGLSDAVQVSRAPDELLEEYDGDEVSDSDATRATVAKQVDLVHARTRHLRERTPPAGEDLDTFRRAIAPIQRDLADPFDDPTRTPRGVMGTLQAARLGGAAQVVAEFLRGATELDFADTIDSINQQILDAQSTVDIEESNGTVVLPYEALRGPEQDYVLATGVTSVCGHAPPLLRVELPPGGIEEAHGIRFSGKDARELADQLDGALVYHRGVDHEELEQLHRAVADLREWLTRAPPRLEAARRGLAVVVALLDTWGCRSRERDELMADLRDSWQAYDNARTLLLLPAGDDAMPLRREDAAQATERRMLHLLRRAQACAEGQQGLDFLTQSAPAAPAVADLLRTSLWAENLPESLVIRDHVFAQREIEMDDDEVTVKYRGEITGADKRPGSMRLHIQPLDEQRYRLAGEIVDGSNMVVGSFPWRNTTKACLAELSPSWLTPQFFKPLPAGFGVP